MRNHDENESRRNVPAPVENGLRPVDGEDVIIVSDGGLPAKPDHTPVSHDQDGSPGEPRRVREMPGDDFGDESMSGGYASVNGKNVSNNRLVWIVLIVMTVICIAVGICSSVLTGYFMKRGAIPPTINAEDGSENTAAVIAARKPSIVEIVSAGSRGSGVIMKMQNRTIYVLTNNHVLSDVNNVRVRFYGEDEAVRASVIGYDAYYDVAVIAVADYTPAYEVYALDVPECFDSATEYAEGDSVVAIGNAMGYGIAAYDGIISRGYELIASGEKTIPVMRTTAVINGGMSGGALFDMDGHFIGLNTYRITASGDELDKTTLIEDTGFATPVAIVYPIYKQIMAYQSAIDGGDVGVAYMARFSKSDASAIGQATFYFNDFGGFTARYTGGKLTVTALDGNMPARGIEVGDVITAIGEHTVTPDICRMCGEVLHYRRNASRGSALKFKIDRGGAQITVVVPDYYRYVA